VYIAILHGDSQGQRTVVYEATPPLGSVQITSHGRQNVTTPPDWRTAPAFTWRAEGGGGGVTAVVEGRHMLLRAEAGGGAARLWCEVELADWVYDGGVVRPHSWTDVAARVPLHYYIHSLASRLTYLRLEVPGQGEGGSPPRVLETRHGITHHEKNWGSRFPHAWLWAQGSSSSSSSSSGSSSSGSSSSETLSSSLEGASVSFVISYGAVGSDAGGPFTHFGHFRDEGKGLAWDFRPDNSFLTRAEVDGCVRFVGVDGWVVA
jgi:hypothetical protein